MEPTIRLATTADAAAVAAIYDPIVERTNVSFDSTPPSAGELRRRIRETLPELPWLVCECETRIVGYAYASQYSDRDAYRWTVTVSVYVEDRWRRRGVARGLYESLFALLRLQGLYSAIAVIALPNEPSVSFHESLGFERVGRYRRIGYKRGAWRDVEHWQRHLQLVEGRPSSPIRLAELQNPDHVDAALTTGVSSIRLP